MSGTTLPSSTMNTDAYACSIPVAKPLSVPPVLMAPTPPLPPLGPSTFRPPVTSPMMPHTMPQFTFHPPPPSHLSCLGVLSTVQQAPRGSPSVTSVHHTHYSPHPSNNVLPHLPPSPPTDLPPLPLTLPPRAPPSPPSEGAKVDRLLPPEPPKPNDPEVLRHIELMVPYVAKNGPIFESYTRAKQANDPKFSFLSEDSGSREATISRQYYKWKIKCFQLKLEVEGKASKHLDFGKVPNHAQVAHWMQTEEAEVVAPRSPAMSDMEMEDDFMLTPLKKGSDGSPGDIRKSSSGAGLEVSSPQTEAHAQTSINAAHTLFKEGVSWKKDVDGPCHSQSANESIACGETAERGDTMRDKGISLTSGVSQIENNSFADVGRSRVDQEAHMQMSLELLESKSSTLSKKQYDVRTSRWGSLPESPLPYSPKESHANEKLSKAVNDRIDSRKSDEEMLVRDHIDSRAEGEDFSRKNKVSCGGTMKIDEMETADDRQGAGYCEDKISDKVAARDHIDSRAEGEGFSRKNKVSCGGTMKIDEMETEDDRQGAGYCEDKISDKVAVDEFGRLIRSGVSDSDSDERGHPWKSRSQSWSRSQDRSRSHSRARGRDRDRSRSISASLSPKGSGWRRQSPPYRWRRSRSRSQSPQWQSSHSRTPPRDSRWGGHGRGDHVWRGDRDSHGRDRRGGRGSGPIPCIFFAKGRCLKGASCRYSHAGRGATADEHGSRMRNNRWETMGQGQRTRMREHNSGFRLREGEAALHGRGGWVREGDALAERSGISNVHDNNSMAQDRTMRMSKADALHAKDRGIDHQGKLGGEHISVHSQPHGVALMAEPSAGSKKLGILGGIDKSGVDGERKSGQGFCIDDIKAGVQGGANLKVEPPSAMKKMPGGGDFGGFGGGNNSMHVFGKTEQTVATNKRPHDVIPMSQEILPRMDAYHVEEYQSASKFDEYMEKVDTSGKQEASLKENLRMHRDVSMPLEASSNLEIHSAIEQPFPLIPFSQEATSCTVSATTPLAYPWANTVIPPVPPVSSSSQSQPHIPLSLSQPVAFGSLITAKMPPYSQSGSPVLPLPEAPFNTLQPQPSGHPPWCQTFVQQAVVAGGRMAPFCSFNSENISELRPSIFSGAPMHGMSFLNPGGVFSSQPGPSLPGQPRQLAGQPPQLGYDANQQVGIPLQPALQGPLNRPAPLRPNSFAFPPEQPPLARPFVEERHVIQVDAGVQNAYRPLLMTPSLPPPTSMPWAMPTLGEPHKRAGESTVYSYITTLDSSLNVPGLIETKHSVVQSGDVDFKSKSVPDIHTLLARLENVSPAPAEVVARKPETTESEAANVNEAGVDVGVVENVSPPANWSPEQVADGAEGEHDQGQPKCKNSRDMKLLRSAVAEHVKELLKPTWREGHLSKEAFKTIAKKAVDKVTSSLPIHHMPTSQEKIDHFMAVSKIKISKLVQGYVDKYLKL